MTKIRYFILLSLMMPLFVCSEDVPANESSIVPQLKAQDLFNPQNIITIEGEVQEVKRVKHMGAMLVGIHLVVESDGKNYNVHLGPNSYMYEIGLEIKRGDLVEIEGSNVEFKDETALIASSVTVAVPSKRFHLRDKNGIPVWSGHGFNQ